METLNGNVEPESTTYEVRVEAIELNLFTEKKKVWVEVKFGATAERTKDVRSKGVSTNEEDFKQFKFSGRKGVVKEIRANYPVDKGQVPDIFLNVYTYNLLKTERIGYYRIKADNSEITHNKPRWYHFKNPTNHSEGQSPGSILADVRLLSGNQINIPRANFKNYDAVKVKFLCFIYGCYELEPDLLSNQVQAGVEIYFSKLTPKTHTNLFLKSEIRTKNPIFGPSQ